MELDVLGVTPKKKKQFESRGIYSVEDLLQYLPRAYRDYRSITGILPHDQVSVLFGTVVSCERRAGNGRQFVTATCERHGKVIIAGKADFDSRYGYSLNQPEVFEAYNERLLRIYPAYRSISGMSSSYLEEMMHKALSVGLADSEILPRDILNAAGEVGMPAALRFIHMPNSMEEVEQGRRRILFNDLLYFAIQNELNRNEVSAGSQYNIKTQSLLKKIMESLPFSLTQDQEKAITEMLSYAEAGRRINALVQGDVGCGKTIICTLMAAAFADSDYGTDAGARETAL